MAAHTGVTVLMRNASWIATTGALIFFLASPVSESAEIDGGIRVGASHTDNVFLATTPDEIDDIVFQASPFFSLLHESPQFDANVVYTFDWFRYSDLKSTSNFHRGEASLTGKAWDDSLTAQLGVERSQTLNDPDDVIPAGRLPLSENLVDLDEWWFNPMLVRQLGSAITLGANYQYSRNQYDTSRIQDNINQIGGLSLENYSAGQGLTWALRYDWRRTEYELSTPWEYQQATAEVGVWANSKTRVFGAGGVESAWDDPFNSALEDEFWEAGFAYSPSDRLSAEFAAGERSFGSSWRGRLDYTFKRGNLAVSYNQLPTSTGFNNLGRGTGFVFDPEDFDDFLSRPGNAQRYLSERFELNLNLNFRRSGLQLAVFDEDRSDVVDANGMLLEDQSQTGVRAEFSWRVGVRTEVIATGSLIERESRVGSESQVTGAGLAAKYRLGSNSDLSLGYNYTEQQPQGQASVGRDYVANVVSLFFTYTM